jgi:hypothetical protein
MSIPVGALIARFKGFAVFLSPILKDWANRDSPEPLYVTMVGLKVTAQFLPVAAVSLTA